MTEALLFLAGGTLALYLGAEWLVRGAARGGRVLGVPALIIGLTVVSLGTSAPELVVSVTSAVQGRPDLALGNVLGSNLANLGLILGLVALIHPIRVSHTARSRDIPLMILLTMAVYPLVRDLEVSRGDGVILLVLMFGYLYILARMMGREGRTRRPSGGSGAVGKGESLPRILAVSAALAVVGAGALILGGQGIVMGASTLGEELGVPELIMGLSVVAIGTSLPELATSLVAAFRGNPGIAVGNVVGSNIFNLGAVLGTTAAVHPVIVSPVVPEREFVAVLVLSLFLLPAAWIGQRVARLDGVLLLSGYGAAWAWFLLT